MNAFTLLFSPKIGGDTEGVENLTIHTQSTFFRPVKIEGDTEGFENPIFRTSLTFRRLVKLSRVK